MKKLTAEQIKIVEKIKMYEDEAIFLCNHKSWGAAEGATEQKCYQIKCLMDTVTPDQKSTIQEIEVKSFLKYLSKGIDYNGPYPSVLDAINVVLGG